MQPSSLRPSTFSPIDPSQELISAEDAFSADELLATITHTHTHSHTHTHVYAHHDSVSAIIHHLFSLPCRHKDPSLLPSAVCESSFSRGLFHCFSPSLYLPYMCVPCLSKWTLISAIFAGLTTTSRICFCTATTPSFSLSLVLIHSNVSVLK